MKKLIASAKPGTDRRANYVFVNSPALTERQCYEIFLTKKRPPERIFSFSVQVKEHDTLDVANILIKKRYTRALSENRRKIYALCEAIRSCSLEFDDKMTGEIILGIRGIGGMSPDEIMHFIKNHFK